MTINDAIKNIKETNKAKFDATVEVHINLSLENKNDVVRFTTTLSHGTGKSKKVAVLASKKVSGADLELTEADIAKLENGSIKPKTDFDILVAEPRFMAKLAKAARVLGPQGAMPNPKTGTVTDDVQSAVNEIKKGKMEVRTEPNGSVIHTIIGKVSFDNDKLVQNYEELMKAVRSNKPQKSKPEWIKSVFISSTMGSSAQVDLN